MQSATPLTGLRLPKRHFNALDLSRLLAACAVLFWHYQHFFVPPVDYQFHVQRAAVSPFYRELWWLFDYGHAAVQYFWAVSGFVFAHVYLADAGARGRFWLARVARLPGAEVGVAAYVQLFQGTPLLMQLFLTYFGIALFGINTSATSITIEPNLFPLILSRMHRWTIGQAVTFFDNDFAGRIAQKQMQVARAATDVVSGAVETAAFSLASVVGSVALLIAIDVRISVLLVIWIIAYILFIRGFLKRIRGASGARAAARAMVTGQIVDTVTNMKTVKLFANSRHEDRVALDAMETFRDRAIEYGIISSWFRLALMALAGVLPVMLVGGTVWLWSKGGATSGEIAAAGAISFRLAQMTGWVSFSLMSIFGNLGEVEDGVKTLTPPYTLADAPDAAEQAQGRAGADLEARIARLDALVRNLATGLQREAKERGALVHRHARRAPLPVRLVMLVAHQVRAGLLDPGRFYTGHRAGIDLRRLDLLGADDPGRLGLELARARVDRNLRAARAQVLAFFLLAHLRQQAGQQRAMDGLVGRRLRVERQL